MAVDHPRVLCPEGLEDVCNRLYPLARKHAHDLTRDAGWVANRAKQVEDGADARSALTAAQFFMAEWCIGAHMKPIEASWISRWITSGSVHFDTECTEHVEAPESDDTERFPCLAIFKPAPAATSEAQVETL